MKLDSWHYQSVQAFFNQFNWQGASQFASNGQDLSSGLSLRLPVAQFFRGIPWEGIPTVGALPTSNTPAPPAQSSESDVTLDALLDIF